MNSHVKLGSLLVFGVLALTAPAALANEFTLTAGKWQITEGLDVGAGGLPSNSRSICIAPNETHVDSTWFAKLAKPSENCRAKLNGQSSSELTFDMFTPPQGPSRTPQKHHCFC